MRRSVTLAVAIVVALGAAEAVSAAQMIARNATDVKILANAHGEAMFSFRVADRQRRVLVWGAVDARVPAPRARQVEFKLDYSGGWHKHKTTKFAGSCRPYDGPSLPNLVAACTAPDGSYWAAQSWRRPLPNL